MKALLVCFCCFYAGVAFSQSVEQEPLAVIEVGGAGAKGLNGEGSSFGGTIAAEVTPIENRLELEGGVTGLFTRDSSEWSVDLLFKKPWTLSKKAEFMAGVGPEWIHSKHFGATSNSMAGEVVADFMYWPSAGKHRVGWYVEPGYEYNFGRGHEQSFGVAGGLLIAVW